MNTIFLQMNTIFFTNENNIFTNEYIILQKNTIFFENYNLKPLNMYNGLSQVYCIKPVGRLHYYTKG